MLRIASLKNEKEIIMKVILTIQGKLVFRHQEVHGCSQGKKIEKLKYKERFRISNLKIN